MIEFDGFHGLRPLYKTEWISETQNRCAAAQLGALPLREGGGAKHSPPGETP